MTFSFPAFASTMDLTGIVAIVTVFGFSGAIASLGIWTDARRKERDAFYKSELLKKISDSPGSAAEPVLALLREEEARKQRRRRDGLMLAGMICVATGVGIMVLLGGLKGVREEKAWMVGIIPLLVGLALIVHVQLVLAKPNSTP